MPSPNKRVYVLGAGFSRPAELPLQAELLGRIRDFRIDNVSAPIAIDWVDWHARVIDLLNRFDTTADLPSIEDVFTVLDQTIAAHDAFRGLGWADVVAAREALNRTILVVLHQSCQSVPERARALYRGIATELLAARVLAGQDADPCSVISLNWDYVLEESLYSCLRDTSLLGRADIDFCCYTTPLDEATVHVPSTKQKARGLYNLKLLKLHGSANFLRCPNCSRLFTAVGSTRSVWSSYVLPTECPHCPSERGFADSEDRDSARSISLEPFFVTPTYVKVFDNPHIRMVWHNAHIELAEATEVVFVGYSLPEADYHVRTLLRRSIRKDAAIRVVLAKADDPGVTPDSRLAGALPAHRYAMFFGKKATFQFSGVESLFPGADQARINLLMSKMREAVASRPA